MATPSRLCRPPLTSRRAQRLHLPLPAVQLGRLLLQLLLPLQQLGGCLRLLLRAFRHSGQHTSNSATGAAFDAGVDAPTLVCEYAGGSSVGFMMAGCVLTAGAAALGVCEPQHQQG